MVKKKMRDRLFESLERLIRQLKDLSDHDFLSLPREDQEEALRCLLELDMQMFHLYSVYHEDILRDKDKLSVRSRWLHTKFQNVLLYPFQRKEVTLRSKKS